jgi:large subunit ribosomal protein L1
MMATISKVAKVLGPRGLMPNPKVGTVTVDVAKAVEEQKKGKVSFRTDKGGTVHCLIGKKSFGQQKLKDNFMVLYSTVMKAKPPTSKGVYLKKVTVSTTMGPPVYISPAEAARLV